jgi:sulfur relay (sulfurtransferase) complex TusBCD TusD component (DsrE family)
MIQPAICRHGNVRGLANLLSASPATYHPRTRMCKACSRRRGIMLSNVANLQRKSCHIGDSRRALLLCMGSFCGNPPPTPRCTY